MNTQASKFVGSIPEHYDSGLGPRIFAAYADDLAGRVKQLAPSSVLELAAGTGIVTRTLRDQLPADCDLVASDLNPPMLDWARNKFHPRENVRFETVDATDLPYEDASFDVVTCQFGVMFFPDKQRSYGEVLRVLKPGGRYVFNVWDSWEHNSFARITHEAAAEFFPDDPPGFYKVPFSYHDVATIEGAVLQAGFASVSMEHLPVHSEIPSAEEFSRGLVFGNPMFDEILSRGGDPEAVHHAIAQVLEDKLGGSMRIQALVVQASKG